MFHVVILDVAFGEKSIGSFKRSNRVVQNKLSIFSIKFTYLDVYGFSSVGHNTQGRHALVF